MNTIRVALVAAALATLAGCSGAPSVPDRAPDARGHLANFEYVAVAGEPAAVGAWVLSDDVVPVAYAGTRLLYRDGVTLVDAAGGSEQDQRAGSEVEVWFGNCKGSSPDQCDLVAIRTLTP